MSTSCLSRTLCCRAMPLASLKDDINDRYNNISWVFGVGDNISAVNVLHKMSSEDASNTGNEPWWSCTNSSDTAHPLFRKYVLYPCLHGPQGQVSRLGMDYISAHAVFKPWFQLENIKMLLTYEVTCRTGLTVSVAYHFGKSQGTEELHRKVFERSSALRQRIDVIFDRINIDDAIALSAFPHGNVSKSCGVRIIGWEVWRGVDAEQMWGSSYRMK